MARGFRHRPALEGLPKGAERQIIDQFKAIQNDLDALRGSGDPADPVYDGAGPITAVVGKLLLLSPPASGVLVMVPAGTPENITRRVFIAVIGGILSPGATVSIVGRKGTINGQQVLNLNSYRLVELVSCGPPGWFHST